MSSTPGCSLSMSNVNVNVRNIHRWCCVSELALEALAAEETLDRVIYGREQFCFQMCLYAVIVAGLFIRMTVLVVMCS